jgi:thiol-disulfide isomerase/thioredoxin
MTKTSEGRAPRPRCAMAGRDGQPYLKIFAALCLLGSALSARAQIKVGDAFPSLAAAGLNGGSLPATAAKVVFVDFWASWCAPCKASFPAYGRIFADYAPRGLVVVAVSVDETAAAYSAFLRKSAPPFPTVRDQSQTLVREVRVPSMPTSYLIGRDGRVRYIHVGFHSGETEQELRGELEALLAEKSCTDHELALQKNPPLGPRRDRRISPRRLRQCQGRARPALGKSDPRGLHHAFRPRSACRQCHRACLFCPGGRFRRQGSRRQRMRL